MLTGLEAARDGLGQIGLLWRSAETGALRSLAVGGDRWCRTTWSGDVTSVSVKPRPSATGRAKPRAVPAEEERGRGWQRSLPLTERTSVTDADQGAPRAHLGRGRQRFPAQTGTRAAAGEHRPALEAISPGTAPPMEATEHRGATETRRGPSGTYLVPIPPRSVPLQDHTVRTGLRTADVADPGQACHAGQPGLPDELGASRQRWRR